jgi:hypothetical protein
MRQRIRQVHGGWLLVPCTADKPGTQGVPHPLRLICLIKRLSGCHSPDQRQAKLKSADPDKRRAEPVIGAKLSFFLQKLQLHTATQTVLQLGCTL